MKVLITGAHFTPALAIVEELKKYKEMEILYVGRGTTREGDPAPSAESQILPNFGVKFIPITAGRWQRAFTIYTIPSLLKIPIGMLQAGYIVLKEKPDIVLSFGGYVAFPVVFVSWLFSIPIILHEQTLVSGLANKISSFFADIIALSFPPRYRLGKKVVYTGNPLRQEILHPQHLPQEYQRILTIAKSDRLPVIYITGGNQGSHLINQAVEGCLNHLLKMAVVIHQTGDSKYQDFDRLSALQSEGYLVKKFIDREIGAVYLKSDLVVARAGVNTLTELAFFGIPSLVIPIPYLYADEQNENARFFQDLGLAKILPQSKLTGEGLLKNINYMLSHLDQLKKDAKKAKSIIIKDAAKRLALETILLAESKKFIK